MNLFNKGQRTVNILAAILFFLIPTFGHASKLYVDASTGVDNLVCDSTNPCLTLLHTVNLSANGDVIYLAPGTYSENPITINTDIRIIGSGKSNTFIQPTSVPDRIFTVSGNDVSIEKLTIQNGDMYDTVNGTYDNGGAILLNSGNLVLNQVKLVNNEALAGGAIEQASQGYLTLLATTVQDNWASSLGGAIHCDRCGGIFLILSALIDNVAGSEGGAIEMEESFFFLSLLSNISFNSAYKGGGISAYSSEMYFFTSQLFANTATNSDGGAIYGSGVGLNIQRSTFADNDASNLSNGGAINLYGTGYINVSNATFSNNSAHHAGAIQLTDDNYNGPTATIANSTFYGNEGVYDANHLASGTFATTFLYNVIIADGTNAFADECSLLGSINGNTNLVRDTTCDGLPANPVTNLDATLSYNGGFTKTHTLFAGSNAIDTGITPCVNPLNPAANQLYDQRGFGYPRPDPISGICDIGAIEFQ